jgi:hypothetical protein
LRKTLRRALFPKTPSRSLYLITLIFYIGLPAMNTLWNVAAYELIGITGYELFLLLVRVGCIVFTWLLFLLEGYDRLRMTKFGQFAHLPRKYVMGEVEARMLAWAKKRHASPASIESILKAYRRYLSKKKDRTEAGEELVASLNAMMDEMGVPVVPSLAPPPEVSGVRIQPDTTVTVEEVPAEPSTTVIPQIQAGR